jgi:hypothetical protein
MGVHLHAQRRLDHGAGGLTVAASIDEREDDTASRPFEEFWAEHFGQENPETEVIFGTEVTVPAGVALSFKRRMEAAKTEDDTRDLIDELFGVGSYDAWVDGGMDELQLAYLLMWGYRCGSSGRVPFEAILGEFRELQAEMSSGKAVMPNRRDRRAATSRRAGSSTTRTSSRGGR